MINNQIRKDKESWRWLRVMISAFYTSVILSCGTNPLEAVPSQQISQAPGDSVLKHQPSIADSIHLWIVPNHMLWIPLEFEDPHYKTSPIEVQ